MSYCWLHHTRVYAAIAVITIHVAAQGQFTNEIGSLNWGVSALYNSASKWCVPIYVIISGYLLYKNNDPNSLNSFYLKRASKILIPLIFWSILFTFWNIYYQKMNVNLALKKILIGKCYYHMWYLYMIIGLYIFSPFLNSMASALSQTRFKFLLIIIFLLLSLNTIANTLHFKSSSPFFVWFIYYIPFYMYGSYLKIYGIKKINILRDKLLIFLLILLNFSAYQLLSIYGKDNLASYFFSYTSIFVIAYSLLIFQLFEKIFKATKHNMILENLGQCTLGIYIIHPIFLDLLINYYPNIFTNFTFVMVPVFVIILFSFSYFVVSTIKKIKYLNIII
ncbi:MAG: hypothetical protein COA79_15705 [Planctomycetota bacterium]|nr:MAG: hypothetical protein COA79_15705 [Planctomycetota bacterium]